MNTVAVCTGSLTTLANGAISCSGTWVAQAAQVPFDPTAIDPAVATALFSGGFALIVGPWAAAFGVRMLLKTIKLL